MSDQRRIVPSETPRAWAACEVERPRGLLLRGSMNANFTRFGKVRQGRAAFAQPRMPKRRWPQPPRCDDVVRGLHTMRLRLYHHHDGARVAYRETGAGPALALLHSLGLSHREWEPIVAPLAEQVPRAAAGPAPARRLRGSPASPVHAGLAGGGDGRLLPRGGRARGRCSPATTSEPSSRCARSRPAG